MGSEQGRGQKVRLAGEERLRPGAPAVGLVEQPRDGPRAPERGDGLADRLPLRHPLRAQVAELVVEVGGELPDHPVLDGRFQVQVRADFRQVAVDLGRHRVSHQPPDGFSTRLIALEKLRHISSFRRMSALPFGVMM